MKTLGHKFNSATDTEVVLKAYLQWGTDCLEKFIGMFAFAIWDSRNQILFLARDRLGIKPLYYHFSENHNTLLFASELKALMAFGGFAKDGRALIPSRCFSTTNISPRRGQFLKTRINCFRGIF